MSKMMLKMLADMAGLKPEDIQQQIEEMRSLTAGGLQALQDINTRLARIEKALDIESSKSGEIIDLVPLERQENGQ